METKISHEEFECIICTEIPFKVLETGCWGVLICDKWGDKLKSWPNNCTKKIELTENKFIQRKINQIPMKCEHCSNEFPRKNISAHQAICEMNPLRPVILNSALHSWVLSMKAKETEWFCQASMMITDGCVQSGKEIVSRNKGAAWTCSNWDISFCKNCIIKYSTIKDKEVLKMLPQTSMHLAHKHLLNLIYDKDVCQLLKEHWIGKYKRGGWHWDEENVKLYVCQPWRVLIWESCFSAEQEDFVEFVSSDFHEHLLHITAVTPIDLWKCSGQFENCLKKDTYLSREWKICYSCDIWDFKAWAECMKKKKVLM